MGFGQVFENRYFCFYTFMNELENKRKGIWPMKKDINCLKKFYLEMDLWRIKLTHLCVCCINSTKKKLKWQFIDIEIVWSINQSAEHANNCRNALRQETHARSCTSRHHRRRKKSDSKT